MPRPARESGYRRPVRASRRHHPLDKLITGFVGGGVLLVMLPKALSRLPGQAVAMAGLQRYGWILLLLGLGLLAFRLMGRAAKSTGAAEPNAFPFRKAPPATAARPTRPPKTPFAEPASARTSPTAATSAPDAPPARPAAWGAEVFRVIEWRRFEALVEALFAQAGFLTRSQSHGSDGGVDIWLHSKHQPDGSPVSIVQCKHWSDSKPVGVDKIRELRGVMAAHQIRRGQFACTARYTDAAREFACDNQINLLDGAALLDLIAKRTPDQQQALLEVALEGEYWKPTCVNCGVKMVFRLPRNEGKGFWGCVNYPRCRGKMNVRSE